MITPSPLSRNNHCKQLAYCLPMHFFLYKFKIILNAQFFILPFSLKVAFYTYFYVTINFSKTILTNFF